MQVLKNNNTIKVTCPHCRSELGVAIEDITYTEMVHHGSPYTAKCGACRRTFDIPSSNIPRDWMSVLHPDD